jgi:hypothetical protein
LGNGVTPNLADYFLIVFSRRFDAGFLVPSVPEGTDCQKFFDALTTAVSTQGSSGGAGVSQLPLHRGDLAGLAIDDGLSLRGDAGNFAIAGENGEDFGICEHHASTLHRCDLTGDGSDS